MACSLLVLCLAASPALANTVTVSTTTDNVPGSLRFAVEKEVEPGGTVIVPAGTYALTVEQLSIEKDVTIEGAGSGSTIITPQHKSRAVFIPAKGATKVKISGVTITEGLAEEAGGEAEGGGIDDIEASLTLENDVISNNVADADGGSGQAGGVAKGGGILAGGPLELAGVALGGNRATANGASGQPGGIAEGGGVWSVAGAIFSIVTFGGNAAIADGGAAGAGGIAEGGSAFVSAASGPLVMLERIDVNAGSASAAGGAGAAGGIAKGGGLAIRLTGPKGSALGLRVSDATVSGSSALAPGGSGSPGGIAAGGGILAIVEAASSIVNATVQGNRVGATGTPSGDGEGGGLWTSGEQGAMTILSSTLDGNVSEAPPLSGGGGNLMALEKISVRDTIVSAGTGPAGHQNCAGTIESLGNNLEDRDECGFHAAGDKVGLDPQLGALGANPAALPLQAPAQSSPAVDAGSACASDDARGVARPQGSACDIGAYELALPRASNASATPSRTSATLYGVVENPDFVAGFGFFQFGPTSAYGLQTSAVPLGALVFHAPLTVTVTGLKPGTLYHFRTVAQNPDGVVGASDMTFTTLPGRAPNPVLSGLALRPSNLHAQKGHGASLAKRRGATLVYKDSQAATTTLTVMRVRRGFRVGGSCRASRPRHAPGHLRRCTRLVHVGSFTHADKGGFVTAHFTGRVRGHALAPGNYRLSARAVTKLRFSSNVLTISFSVAR